MRAVLVIAANAFREAVRQRVLYNLLAFAVILIGLSTALGSLSIADDRRIPMDLSLASMALFGGLMAILIGIGLVYQEIDKRTAHTILARPIRRWQFILGKYLGLMAVLAVNVALMTGAAVLVITLRGAGLSSAFWACAYLTLVELALLTAAAMAFSSFTTPTLSAVFALSLYAIGHLIADLKDLAPLQKNPWTERILIAVYYGVPNLENFNLRAAAVHALPVPAARLAWTTLYGLAWAGAFLALAMLIFSRRDLK